MSSPSTSQTKVLDELGCTDKEGATAATVATSGGQDNDITQDIDGDYGSYGGHVFSDPKVADYWKDVYENARYEGRHRFDPSFTWSAAEEKRLKRNA